MSGRCDSCGAIGTDMSCDACAGTADNARIESIERELAEAKERESHIAQMLGDHAVTLSLSEARCKELEPVVQAAVDWCEDGNECHFCGVNSDDGPHDHDDECPLGQYLKAQARAALTTDGDEHE